MPDATPDLLLSVTDPTLTVAEAAPWVRELESRLREVRESFHHRGPRPGDGPTTPARPKPRPKPTPAGV